MRTRVVLAISFLMLAACARDSTFVSLSGEQTPVASGPYSATTTVLESPDHGPQLCLGGVELSYPPQCGGPDVVGWDWGAAGDEESANGTIWGTYAVVGTWDGQRFTVTEPPQPPSIERGPTLDLSTPCPPPPGGWTVVNPATATSEGESTALRYARLQPDFAGAWVDQSINPASHDEPVDETAMNDPTRLVLNLRFTGDLERHEGAVRAVWGGPLCVTAAERPLSELLAVQDELHDELGALSSSVDEVRGVVGVTVVVADKHLQRTLDERYGEGVVELTGALEPLD
jgi:hypothetical protein